MRPCSLVLAASLVACAGEVTLGDDTDRVDPDPPATDSGSADTGTPAVPDPPPIAPPVDTAPPVVEDTAPAYDPRLDEAVLVIDAPRSGALYTIEDGIPLQGHVEDVDGNDLGVTGLRWSTTGETFTGTDGVFEVDPGTYTVDVGVVLDNGDRLASSIGGIRVQHPRTGVYVGTVNVVASGELNGTPIQTNCIGSLDFTVNRIGRKLTGKGRCLLSLIVTDPAEVTFDLNGDLNGDAVSGNVGIDVLLFQLPYPFTGGFAPAPGTRFTGSYVADIPNFLKLEGSLDARRVTQLLP